MHDKKINKWFIKLLYFDKECLGLFGVLPSLLKVFLYRMFGGEIGRNVVIPRGTYLFCDSFSIGDNSEFGKRSIFEIGSFTIGSYAKFEDGVSWCCRKASIGNIFYCSAGAKVGWGGEFDDEAELVIGDSSFIGEETMLNPCRLIKIGSNVAIGAGSKIYTHQFWQSVLEGYMASSKSVIIEENVMIGCNCAILPGSYIRRGATVVANSTVCGNVREFSMVAGIPAVEMLSSKIYPKKLDEAKKETILKNIFNQFMEKIEIKNKANYFFIFNFVETKYLPQELRGKRLVVLSYNYKLDESTEEESSKLTVFVCSKNEIIGHQDYLSDELREFLRKRGIKFSPILWRYKRCKRV